jgi:hypothetical protein
MAEEQNKILPANPKIGAELITVANILGGLDVAEASSVAKITHSYARVTKLEGEPELDVTKFLRYKLLAPACDEINTALASKLGISKEALYTALEKGGDSKIVAKANEVLNSKEFAKELEPKMQETLAKCRTVIDKGVEAGFYTDKDGRRYDSDFHAIQLAHKSLPGGVCPTGCPMAAATDIYNKPAATQAVPVNAK